MLLLTTTILGFLPNSTWENFLFTALLHTHPVGENGAMKLQRRPDKIICSLIFCSIFGAVLAAEEESRSSYIVAQENKRLHGYAVKRIDSTDEMSCSQACLRHSWCSSSNFKESSGNCELNKHEFSITADDDTKLTVNTGTTFSMFLKVSRREVCQQRTRCN